jgi:hypothetical protein
MVAVGSDANPLDDPADAAALAGHAAVLADAVEAALPGWVERTVLARWSAWQGASPPAGVIEAARAAGRQAGGDLLPRLRELLATDVDAQRSNPLAVIRSGVAYATTVLRDAGVPPVRRDADAERLFPDDVYDLTPAAFADLDPSVHEPGITWGAAKAHVILRRRRRRPRPTTDRGL